MSEIILGEDIALVEMFDNVGICYIHLKNGNKVEIKATYDSDDFEVTTHKAE